MKHNEPEFKSIVAFVEFLVDDERETFLPAEAQKVGENVGLSLKATIEALEGFGLKVSFPQRKAETRGYTANNHDRWSEKNGFVGGTGIGGTSRHMVSHWQPK